MTSKLRNVSDRPVVDLPAPLEWRKACVQRMEELGVSQSELVKHIGTEETPKPQSGVSQALSLSMARRRSQWVSRISHALGVDLPAVARAEIIAKGLAAQDPGRLEAIELLVKNDIAPEWRAALRPGKDESE